jgi:hypothetical protein
MSPQLPQLTVLDHPLLKHKLGYLRDKNTSSAEFRDLVKEISRILAHEVMRDWKDLKLRRYRDADRKGEGRENHQRAGRCIDHASRKWNAGRRAVDDSHSRPPGSSVFTEISSSTARWSTTSKCLRTFRENRPSCATRWLQPLTQRLPPSSD